jgi:hypothetical protein
MQYSGQQLFCLPQFNLMQTKKIGVKEPGTVRDWEFVRFLGGISCLVSALKKENAPL